MIPPGRIRLRETPLRTCVAVCAVFVIVALALVLHAGCVRRPEQPLPQAPVAPSPTQEPAQPPSGATAPSQTDATRPQPAEVDAAHNAAARKVVAEALGWREDEVHVFDLALTEDGGVCGAARCEDGPVACAFALARIDDRLALASLGCTSAPGESDHRIGPEELLRSAETFAARAYCRWTPDSMHLEFQHETRLSGPARWFEWEQVTAEGYYTGNSLSVVIRSDTGNVDAYTARFAKLPLKQPRVARETAGAMAERLVRDAVARYGVPAKWHLLSGRCLLSSPLAEEAPGPVWLFEYEATMDMPHPPRIMHSILVDAVTGKVVEQDPPPRVDSHGSEPAHRADGM